MFNGQRRSFITYEPLPNPIDIGLGDETLVRVTHHGILLLQNQQIDAFHTPTFRCSLLSVGDLDRRGYDINFCDGKCTIFDAQRSITMTGRRNGQLYQVDPSISDPHALLADSDAMEADPDAMEIDSDAQVIDLATHRLSTTESDLWHRHLGHIHHAAMRSLINGYTYEDVCETCVLAKHERKIIRIHNDTVRTSALGYMRPVCDQIRRRGSPFHRIHR